MSSDLCDRKFEIIDACMDGYYNENHFAVLSEFTESLMEKYSSLNDQKLKNYYEILLEETYTSQENLNNLAQKYLNVIDRRLDGLIDASSKVDSIAKQCIICCVYNELNKLDDLRKEWTYHQALKAAHQKHYDWFEVMFLCFLLGIIAFWTVDESIFVPFWIILFWFMGLFTFYCCILEMVCICQKIYKYIKSCKWSTVETYTECT